jgi:DNA-binding NarL/FixJ family response regulator
MRILILEDDPFIALDLQAIVESQGHDVVGSFDSLAGAREVLGDRFDFALLDIDVRGRKELRPRGGSPQKAYPFRLRVRIASKRSAGASAQCVLRCKAVPGSDHPAFHREPRPAALSDAPS